MKDEGLDFDFSDVIDADTFAFRANEQKSKVQVQMQDISSNGLRKCIHCLKPFIPNRKDQKYCSSGCRKNHSSAAQKARKKAIRESAVQCQ